MFRVILFERVEERVPRRTAVTVAKLTEQAGILLHPLLNLSRPREAETSPFLGSKWSAMHRIRWIGSPGRGPIRDSHFGGM